MPALAAAAAATTTLRIGSFVFDNDYRNPVMLAKEATTLDLLSSGRLEFGIGAGWSRRDYQQLGIPYDPPKVRVDRMEEAVTLMKRLWTEDKVTHEGPHYRVREATVLPRPTQRPHPPLMIGASGPRMLRIAAREAQIVAFVPSLNRLGLETLRSMGTESVEKRITMLRRTPRFSEIELNVIVFDAAVTDAARSVVGALTARLKSAATAIVESPFLLYGSRASIVEDLLARRERLGISYFAIPGRAMRAFGPVVVALRGK